MKRGILWPTLDCYWLVCLVYKSSNCRGISESWMLHWYGRYVECVFYLQRSNTKYTR